jgi:formylmethanofuran dehydrogenase subunit C
MTKLINEEKVEEKVINEEKFEEQVVEEIPDTQIIQFDTVYQSNENFEIEKPTSISVENSKPVLNQVKINNLIKLKKW